MAVCRNRVVARMVWWTLVLCALCRVGVESYAIPSDLKRHDLAGIWCLTGQRSFLPTSSSHIRPTSQQQQQQQRLQHPQPPLKEFTVYPLPTSTKPNSNAALTSTSTSTPPNDNDGTVVAGVFLKLYNNGSFVQSGSSDDDDDDDDEDDDMEEEEEGTVTKTNDDILGIGVLRGVWDYVDGKLILATDRPNGTDHRHVHDTILEGLVVATAEASLVDNPARSNLSSKTTTTELTEPTTASSAMDVHLSVPEGSVKIGKFMYPKRHPSFFDQTIFNPLQTGKFRLHQVLGSLNAYRDNDDDDESLLPEKFRRDQFYDKTFYLTSRPLNPRRKKTDRPREVWSRSEQRYVPVEPTKEELETEGLVDIRVHRVQFYKNHTFATVGPRHYFDNGASTSSKSSSSSSPVLLTKVLRGKWNLVGKHSDQLWMQVFRFGFGRSVSGSTFSEGTFLNQNDERAYWGTITEVIRTTTITNVTSSSQSTTTLSQNSIVNQTLRPMQTQTENATTLEIEGAVMLGFGLEPVSIGRFTMVEETEEYDFDWDDDDDDDDEYDDDDGDNDDNVNDIDYNSVFQ